MSSWAQAIPAMEHDSARLLFGAACDYRRAARVVRPGIVNVLERVAAARERPRVDTWRLVAPVLSPRWRSVLDGLLAVDGELGMTPLAWLEQSPTTPSPTTVRVELDKLAFLRRVGADGLDLSILAVERRRLLARVVRRSTARALARRDEDRRYPMLASYLAQCVPGVLYEVVG